MDIEKKVQILIACSSKKGNRCSSCPAFGYGNRNCMKNAMRDAADAISMLKDENKKLKEYARDTHNTLNDLYGACGKFCDDTISSFWERWVGKDGDTK